LVLSNIFWFFLHRGRNYQYPFPAEAIHERPRYRSEIHFRRTLTTEQKKQYLNTLNRLRRQLRAAGRGFSEQQLNTPYREGGWTCASWRITFRTAT